jgi:Fe-S cluster biogenesis protein NfuA
MSNSAAVEAVIARIRPTIVADGGDIELVGLTGRTARVRLTGACAGCPMAHMTLHLGLESALRRVDPRLRVEAVQ